MLKTNYELELSATDRLIFAQLVTSDHYLRQLKATLDFTPCRALVAECYAPKMGRGAIDPVRLLKLLLLGEHYALADEKLMQMAQVPFQVAVVSAKVRSREAAATWKGCCTLHHHAQRIRQYFQ